MQRQQFLPVRHKTSSTLGCYTKSESNYRPPFYGTMVVERFLLCSNNERQQSVNDIGLASWKMHGLQGKDTA